VLSHADARGVYRVKREFRSIAGLQHPNLVTLHELVHDLGQWFFTMELVDGVPFDRWLCPFGEAADEDRLLGALRQLASAVCAIHAAHPHAGEPPSGSA
jgi:serine/threonine protein kinase